MSDKDAFPHLMTKYHRRIYACKPTNYSRTRRDAPAVCSSVVHTQLRTKISPNLDQKMFRPSWDRYA